MNKKFEFKKLTTSREMSLVIVLIVLCGFIQVRNATFLGISNINDLLVNASILSILALGMMCVLLIAGIDIRIANVRFRKIQISAAAIKR